VRGEKAAVISRPFDGISCGHAREAVERVDRERSLVSHSQADRRGAAQWNHRRQEAANLAGVPNLSQKGTRLGNWLTRDQAKKLLTVPDRSKIKGKRDYVILALLLGCALRRQELASLDVNGIQMREGRWVLPDLRGKGGRVRTVAIPIWVKHGIDAWMVEAKIEDGRLLRPLSKSGKLIGDELGDWAVWSVVEQSAKEIGIEHFGAHDLRRTCAKLCRKNGGDLEQIKFLLGHSSIQTTERYLGSEQEIKIAVNDNLGLS
jgi:integrase